MARPRKPPAVIWSRDSQGIMRARCDLRAYKDSPMALCAPGQTLGTTDPEEASTYLAREIKRLRLSEQKHPTAAESPTEAKNTAVSTVPDVRRRKPRQSATAIGPYAAHHLVNLSEEYRRAGRTLDWLPTVELYLQRAESYFSPVTDLAHISTEDVDA